MTVGKGRSRRRGRGGGRGRQGRAIGRRRRHRRGARPARGGPDGAGARRSRWGGLGSKRRGRCPEGGAPPPPPPPPGCGHYDYFGRQGASAATARRRGGLRSSVSRSLPQSPACAALPALGPRHQNRGVPLSDLIDRCCSLLQIYKHTQTTRALPPSLLGRRYRQTHRARPNSTPHVLVGGYNEDFGWCVCVCVCVSVCAQVQAERHPVGGNKK